MKKLFTEVVQEKRKLLFEEELHFELLQQNKDVTFDGIFTAHYFSNVTKSIKILGLFS